MFAVHLLPLCNSSNVQFDEIKNWYLNTAQLLFKFSQNLQLIESNTRVGTVEPNKYIR